MPVFYDFALLLAAAAAVGLLMQLLKQPLLIAFIAVGILVGPAGVGLVEIGSEIELLAKTGIGLLLFTVGLKLDLQVIRTMGTVSLATGLGQVLFTSVVGYILCLGLGLAHIEAVYVAIALTFSSTIIIVKLLSDKREVDSLHGRIAIGFLIVQDLVVVIAMIVLVALGAAGESGDWSTDIAWVIFKGLGMLAAVGLLMRYVLPRLFKQAAYSTEMLTVLGIAWAVGLAAGAEHLGFSKEVGAFLAGVSLAGTPYRDALSARLTVLRDFFLLFFFVDLGAYFDLSALGAQLTPALILSAFVLIGNPLIVLVIMGAMGYRKRTGFLAGLTVAQISEFSLMFGALGRDLGHINQDVLALITIVGLTTITLSTYMIIYSHPLYQRLAPLLSVFERSNPFREGRFDDASAAHGGAFDAIVLGMGRFGSGVARELVGRGKSVLGADFNPDVVQSLRDSEIRMVYGDAEDPEFCSELPLRHARWIICATSQASAQIYLLKALRGHGYGGKVATTAYHEADVERLANAGSDVVLRPFAYAAKESAEELLRLG